MLRHYSSALTLAVMAAVSTLALAGGGGPGRGAATAPAEPPVVLPKSIPADGKPQINGPRIASGNVNHLFLYKLPATGDGELTFSADNLPYGLTLDAKTGIITGKRNAAVTEAVNFRVKSAKGEATKQVVIVVGDHKLALTPPLGWNSWNCWGLSVTDARVRAAADGFFNSGLVNHGFQYVNIDDGWEIQSPRGGRGAATGSAPAGPAQRAPDGTILCNTKFPDMKALGDYIHSKGLKFGIYSSPGPSTCGGYTATWQHEEQDATTWASWGVDYIKYDWCSYNQVVNQAIPAEPGEQRFSNFTLKQLKRPYQVLRQALDKQDRDIVYSLCQYGMGNVWEWGAEDGINGNLWRATGDITDTWSSMSGIGFAQNGHEKYAGPGHWNDTDMLVVGKVGWGNNVRANRMTPNEQMTHIGLWSILAAPMLLGCDLTQLDEFTTNMMSNDEVLAVNQDPGGKQGHRIASMNADGTKAGSTPPPPASTSAPATGRGRGGGNPLNSAPKQVWARELWDGTMAVGLFNLSESPATVSITLKELNEGLKMNIAPGSKVRDLWQHKDLAPVADSISAEVPRHGMALLKIGNPKPDAECVAALVKMYPMK
jgi:alpha-galactosidase